jgi:hypothetical protein
MTYVLTGFTQNLGFRVFGFDGLGAEHSREGFIVKTDLSLIRKYGIRVQDLPLLCRGVLERRDESLDQRTFTYSESDMRSHATVVADRQAMQRRSTPPPRTARQNLGTAWRARPI